jgi:large subunit ribosomal protein L3
VTAEKKTEKTKLDPDVFVRTKLLGRKLGMTQLYEEDGTCVPLCIVEAGPCTVVQIKSSERDGYNAVQVGYMEKTKGVPKPQKGHFEKAGVTPTVRLSELKLKHGDHGLKPGSKLTVEIFEGVKSVDVTGIGIGKGFAGTVTRWHFKRGPASHGSMNIRQPGAIGASSDPSRVFKGTRMGGHRGARKTTVRNLKVVRIDADKNQILIKGSVPGPRGAFVEILASHTKKKRTTKA